MTQLKNREMMPPEESPTGQSLWQMATGFTEPKLGENLSIMLKTSKPFEAITKVAEKLILLTLASQYMLGRFDFFQLFIEKLGIDIDRDPSKIFDMPVSLNFQGNFWRLRALYMLTNMRGRSKIISEMNFMKICKRLELSEKFFTQDQNSWGLGLTYNLLGRIYSFREQSSESNHENFELATAYYTKSIENFKKCGHSRGLYTTIKALVTN